MLKFNKVINSIKKFVNQSPRNTSVILVLSIVTVGVIFVAISHASINTISIETERGTRSGNVTVVDDPSASNKQSVRFGKQKTTVLWRNNKSALFNTSETLKKSDGLDLSNLIIGQQPGSWFTKNPGSIPGQNGQFRATCEPSHISNDDAIVYPNKPNAAHEHIFYGNTGSDAYSTSDSIVNSGSSSCAGGEANRTSYWFPTMEDSAGMIRIPNEMYLYYKGEGINIPAGGFSSLPQGIKMLAGNSKSLTPQMHDYNDGFACGDLFSNPTSDLIPAGTAPLVRSGDSNPTTRDIRSVRCKGGEIITSPWNGARTVSNLKQKVYFPRCWNSTGLNPTDVTYPVNGACPAGTKYVFPEISILFVWELAPGETTDGWKLSSDHVHNVDGSTTTLPGGTTRHGDYIAGWNKKVIDSWTQNCLNNDWNCQSQFISNSTIFDGINYSAKYGAGQYPYLKPVPLQGRFVGKGPCILQSSSNVSSCDKY